MINAVYMFFNKGLIKKFVSLSSTLSAYTTLKSHGTPAEWRLGRIRWLNENLPGSLKFDQDSTQSPQEAGVTCPTLYFPTHGEFVVCLCTQLS